MEIYVAHLRKFDFRKDLYETIRQSSLNNEHTFVFPHENSDASFNSKDYLNKEADLLIGEVSKASTGLGIGLGWADIYGVPIVCIYRRGAKIFGSLKVVSKHFVEYSNREELISGIRRVIDRIGGKT
jgi:hypothetical protein